MKSRLTGYAVVGLLASLCVEVPARAESPRVNSTLRKLAAVATTQQGRAALRRYAETTSELERQGQAYLALGYREYQAGQFVAAVGDLRRAAQTGFTLSDVARYYQADAARQGGLPALAIEALEGFGANFPQSVLRFEALALQARLLLEAGQAERAISALLAEPRVRQRPDIALILADAYRAAGREIEAARAYQDVYYGFAASAEARLAAAALRQLRALLGPNFPQVSEEVQTARADTLFSRERYDDAFAEFTSLLGARPESSYSARWRVGRGRCLVRLRQYPEAVATLQATVPDDPALDALRLATLVEAHRRANDVQAMLRTLDELRSAYPQSPFLAAVLSEVGEYYVRQLDWSRAGLHYQTLLATFPRSEYAALAQWRVAWAYYLQRDRQNSQEALVTLIRRYPQSSKVPAAVYWLGRLAEARGDRREAQALYRLLRTRWRKLYYGLEAEKRWKLLAGEGGAEDESSVESAMPRAAELERVLPPAPAPRLDPCAREDSIELLRPFVILKALALEDLGAQHLRLLLAERPHEPAALLALARYEKAQRRTDRALMLARRAFPDFAELEFSALPREVWETLYPRDFHHLIEQQAHAHGLEVPLVLGLIRQESAFNPRATSVADARGLMQILPSTAARSRQQRRAVARRLYQPAYNLRVGCGFLRGLLNKFDGIPERALAAYHAGSSRVSEWLAKQTFQDAAEFLESIPIASTRVYVEAVLRDAEIYRQLRAGAASFKKCE